MVKRNSVKMANCLVKYGQTKVNKTRMGHGHDNMNIFHNAINQYNHHELKSAIAVITPNGISWPPNNDYR